MTPRIGKRGSALEILLIAIIVVLFIGFHFSQTSHLGISSVKAQGPGYLGCPRQETETVGWPKNYYENYDLSQLPDTAPYNVKTQVKDAMTMWDQAARFSCLNIGFRDVTGTSQPVDLQFVVGSAGEAPSRIYLSIDISNNTLYRATINIDVYNLAFFNPSQSGFGNVFTKAALHEVGHSLGLGILHNRFLGSA